jgi:uncharacterized OB-fold protein
MADATEFARPIPLPDSLSSGFWAAASRRELAIQRCAACRTFQHPPRPLCRACGGADLAFETVSGRGTLWSWTTTYHGVLAGFEATLPYTCLVVELAEQPGLFVVSDLVGREAIRGSLAVGMAVKVCFPAGPEPPLPQFEIAAP